MEALARGSGLRAASGWLLEAAARWGQGGAGEGTGGGRGAASSARRCCIGSGQVCSGVERAVVPSVGARDGRWCRRPATGSGRSVSLDRLLCGLLPGWVWLVAACGAVCPCRAAMEDQSCDISLAEREMQFGLLALVRAGSVCCDVLVTTAEVLRRWRSDPS